MLFITPTSEFMNIHESLLIDSFIIKSRQHRYIELINSRKGRIKFRKYIAHFKDLNEDLALNVSAICNSYDQVFSLLISKFDIDRCYCISENSKYDQREFFLSDALKELYNSGISYFLSCIPGKLVYYEGEDFNRQLILCTY